MSSTLVIKAYDVATTINKKVNIPVLTQEIQDAVSVTTKPGEVTLQGSQVHCTFTELVSPEVENALDAVVAAHEGEEFSSAYQSTSAADDVYGAVPIEATAADGWVDVIDFDSGALPAGQYKALWSCEHRVDQEVDGDDSEIQVQLEVNGVYVETNSDSNQSEKYHSFSNGIVKPVVDGEHIRMRLRIRKTGAGAAKAVLRRARYVQTLVAGGAD